jgi:hypothetical protein
MREDKYVWQGVKFKNDNVVTEKITLQNRDAAIEQTRKWFEGEPLVSGNTDPPTTPNQVASEQMPPKIKIRRANREDRKTIFEKFNTMPGLHKKSWTVYSFGWIELFVHKEVCQENYRTMVFTLNKAGQKVDKLKIERNSLEATVRVFPDGGIFVGVEKNLGESGDIYEVTAGGRFKLLHKNEIFKFGEPPECRCSA